MKSAIFACAAFLLAVPSLLAQYPTKWEVSLMGGASNYYGDFSPKNVVSTETHIGFGASAAFYPHPKVAFRFNYAHGRISGKDANFPFVSQQRQRGFDFSAKTGEISSMLIFEPLGFRYTAPRKFKRGFSPYIGIGAGLVYYDFETNFHENTGNLTEETLRNVESDRTAKYKNPSTLLVITLGNRLYLSRRFAVGGEFSAKPTSTDYLDGVSRAGNMKNKDWLFFAGATAIYYVGRLPKDSDHDGTPDSRDDCPEDKGPRRLNGCPSSDQNAKADRDGDGVPDKSDACPDEYGHMINRGCPEKG